jgi:hypothetical protein
MWDQPVGARSESCDVCGQDCEFEDDGGVDKKQPKAKGFHAVLC